MLVGGFNTVALITTTTIATIVGVVGVVGVVGIARVARAYLDSQTRKWVDVLVVYISLMS